VLGSPLVLKSAYKPSALLSRHNIFITVWLRSVLFNLNLQQTDPTVIFEDNTAAIKWSSGGSRRAKHIDLNVYFVHEVLSMKHAILKNLPTAEQVADILTKPLEANIFSFFARQAWLLARRCVGIRC
jgi:hypothetical protein